MTRRTPAPATDTVVTSPALRSLRRIGSALAATALVLGGCSLAGGGDEYTITAEFSRAYTLFSGSSVRVLGVDVGKIDELQIDPSRDTVMVTLTIDGDVDLPANASAVIIPETLLGERYVQILPAYTGGPALDEGGLIPVERTRVPAEFDEILESLNRFVGGLDENEVGRLTRNLAQILDGQGIQFGETLDAAYGAVQVLNAEDQDLVRLASRLSDLNETIASRDSEIARLLTNYNILIKQIVDERGDLDQALTNLVRITDELGQLMSRQRPGLERDIETLTQLTRSSNRNLDEISLAILSSAELFGHAERVFEFDRNLLPLVDHAGGLGRLIAESLEDRLVGLCLRSGVDQESCDQIPLDDLVPADLCLPPLIPCADGQPEPTLPFGDTETQQGDPPAEPLRSAGDVIRDVIDSVPGFDDALRRQANDLFADQSSSLDLNGILGLDTGADQEVAE